MTTAAPRGYAYAEVYVDASRQTAVASTRALGLRRVADSAAPLLHDDLFEVEFRRNPDVDEQPSGFTAFATLIEVASRDGAEHQEIVALVDRILSAIRADGHRAVAVADFESELAPAPPEHT